MTRSETFVAVIVAAGGGSRMRGLDKLFTEVAGKPLLAHAIAPFQECRAFNRIVIVVSAENLVLGQELVRDHALSKVAAVVPGGERRQDSVRFGVEALGECDYVAAHDGARPLVDDRLIARGLEAVRETGAAVPAVPLADTVKEVGQDALVVRTVDRTRLWAVQTPQFFRYDLLRRAHSEHPEAVTDDAALLEAMGLPVKIFPGDKRNIKVTTPEDLELVRALLGTAYKQKRGTDSGENVADCPFCDYSDSEAVVYEDDMVFAAVDRQPVNRYHLLVIPKRHYTDLVSLPEEVLARVALVVRDLSSTVRALAMPDALTHVSDDDVTGAGFNLVGHFKFHVIPRYKNDPVMIDWHRPPPEREERLRVAGEVREALIRRRGLEL